MFPDTITIVFYIGIVIFINFLAFILPRKWDIIVEILLLLAILVSMFVTFSFTEAMLLMSLSAMAYSNFTILFNKEKRKKRIMLEQALANYNFERLQQPKEIKRIVIDLLLALFVSLGALVFFMFAPDTYSVLKLIVGFALIAMLTQMISRISNYMSTTTYWLPEQDRLIIISAFESRDLPMSDIKEVKRETSPDILKLHPLFTFLSSNQDYTTSFQHVLRLSFPGENIYLTPQDIDVWEERFSMFVDQKDESIKKVLPFYHPTVLRRLFWKGYFALTVKGVSAYTGFIFILIWFDVPSSIIIVSVLIWWTVNILVSDRVLIAATDAIPLSKGEIFRRAQILFKKAGIPNTKLYMIDSPIYNGLATGVNIGRGTVMLTKATMSLPIESVESILAHETIHVKKRDVLTNQMARMLFFGILALVFYLFFDQIKLLADNLFIFIPVFYLLFILFPIYLSFVSQWTEIRADHFGAQLLTDGHQQMAQGLTVLGHAQDADLAKTAEYSMVENKKRKVVKSTDRPPVFYRLIEYQIQLHPPLYWRISCLSKNDTWKNVKKEWFRARFTESLPDFLFRHRKMK